MRHRTVRTLFVAAVTAAVALGALAAGPEPEPGPGGVVGGPLEHVGTLPLDAGNGFGSTVHENLYIVTGPSKLTIYDTSQLTGGMPTPIGAHPLPGVAWNEEPRTDGTRLLMVDDSDVRGPTLYVFDISDPTSPSFQVQFPLPEPSGHLLACVYEDCSVVYTSAGLVLDITDMTNPVAIGDWTDAAGVEIENDNHHSIEQVAPGIVMTGTEPMYLLDAGEDPANPTVVASGRIDERGMIQGQLDTSVLDELPGTEDIPRNQPRYFAARVEWPARTTEVPADQLDPTALLPQHERWGIVSVETPFAADCAEGSGPLLTYDMDRVEEDGTFTVADDYRITASGTYTDGLAPAHTTGCFAYAFSQHPDYTETRLVAAAWTEHGMRLVTIGEDDGHIDEVGFFVGYGGTANDAEWIAEDLIAITDTERGVDIVWVDLDDL